MELECETQDDGDVFMGEHQAAGARLDERAGAAARLDDAVALEHVPPYWDRAASRFASGPIVGTATRGCSAHGDGEEPSTVMLIAANRKPLY